jgi:hypothetical protein
VTSKKKREGRRGDWRVPARGTEERRINTAGVVVVVVVVPWWGERRKRRETGREARARTARTPRDPRGGGAAACLPVRGGRARSAPRFGWSGLQRGRGAVPCRVHSRATLVIRAGSMPPRRGFTRGVNGRIIPWAVRGRGSPAAAAVIPPTAVLPLVPGGWVFLRTVEFLQVPSGNGSYRGIPLNTARIQISNQNRL